MTSNEFAINLSAVVLGCIAIIASVFGIGIASVLGMHPMIFGFIVIIAVSFAVVRNNSDSIFQFIKRHGIS